MKCEVRRYNNSMMCGLCGLSWSRDDTEPPPCNPKPNRLKNLGKRPNMNETITTTDWQNLREAVKSGDWSNV